MQFARLVICTKISQSQSLWQKETPKTVNGFKMSLMVRRSQSCRSLKTSISSWARTTSSMKAIFQRFGCSHYQRQLSPNLSKVWETSQPTTFRCSKAFAVSPTRPYTISMESLKAKFALISTTSLLTGSCISTSSMLKRQKVTANNFHLRRLSSTWKWIATTTSWLHCSTRLVTRAICSRFWWMKASSPNTSTPRSSRSLKEKLKRTSRSQKCTQVRLILLKTKKYQLKTRRDYSLRPMWTRMIYIDDSQEWKY